MNRSESTTLAMCSHVRYKQNGKIKQSNFLMEILSHVAITFLQFFSKYCLTGSKRAIVSADS